MKKLYVIETLNPENNEWIHLEFWIESLREAMVAWGGPEYRTRRVTSREEAETLSKKLCNHLDWNNWDLDTYEWDWPTVSEETK